MITNAPACTVDRMFLMSTSGLKANMPPEVRAMSDGCKKRCAHV